MALQHFDAFFDPLFGDDWMIEPIMKRARNQSVATQNMKQFSPILSADLIETETDFNMHVDLPGVPKEDVEITVSGNTVTIKAERKEAHESKTDTVHRVERSFGTVQRTLRIPKNADSTNVSAKMENGVLLVSFPKKAIEDAPRKVQVA